MYATSFRIKIDIPLFNTTQYINGCCGTTGSYNKGELIFVEKRGELTTLGCTAEVIESMNTQKAPSEFGWKIV